MFSSQIRLEIGSNEWKEYMVKSGYVPRKELLDYYGSHIELERADLNKNFEFINNMMTQDDLQREFLLRHIARTRIFFGPYNCEKVLTFEHLAELNKYINEVL